MMKLSCITFLFILLVLTYTSADIHIIGDRGHIDVINGRLLITITGNKQVPMFFFGLTNDTTRYKVQFSKAYQAKNNKPVPGTSISLPSLEWQWSDFELTGVHEDQTLQFNITTIVDEKQHDVPNIQFRMHITSDTLALKFDTVLYGMNTLWQNASTSLVLCYKFIESDSDGNTVDGINMLRDSDTKYLFDSAFMSIAPNAIDTITGQNVRAMLVLNDDNDNSVCISYDKFEDGIVHDPEVGLFISPSLSEKEKLIIVCSVAAAVFVGVVSVISIIVGLFVRWRKPQQYYSSIE